MTIPGTSRHAGHADRGAIRDALTVLEEREPEAAQAATAALEWMVGARGGRVSEARAREYVSLAPEDAPEEGRLTPGTPGFRRRQA